MFGGHRGNRQKKRQTLTTTRSWVNSQSKHLTG